MKTVSKMILTFWKPSRNIPQLLKLKTKHLTKFLDFGRIFVKYGGIIHKRFWGKAKSVFFFKLTRWSQNSFIMHYRR